MKPGKLLRRLYPLWLEYRWILLFTFGIWVFVEAISRLL